jgi:hypothetical protein
VALARVEVEDLTEARVERLVARLDADRPADDDNDCRLPHLMFAERVTGPQLDEHDPLRPVA